MSRCRGVGVWAVSVLTALSLLLPSAARPQGLSRAELAQEAARLLQELARLRGLPAPAGPMRIAVRSREERRRFILGEFQRKFPADRFEADRRALVAWGLVPADFDLASFMTDLILEQAAAYYDPVAKVMVLANWLPVEAQREALAHELVHLLQDGEVDLDRFLAPRPGKGDEALARQTLIEGEAVALGLERLLRRHGQDLAQLPDVAPAQRAIVTSSTGPMLGRTPRFLQSLLVFPYTQGLGFVHAFRRRHPWAELSSLYRDPPRSTAQILHPERYFDRREDPLPVSLPDLGPPLGLGARLVTEDEAGEFGLTGVLQEFLGEAATATGWRGDRYALWDDPGGTPVLASVSVWESETAAETFAQAYTRLVATKHALGGPVRKAPLLTAWQAGGQAFLVERRGRDVLLLERAPGSALDALRDAVWARR